MQKYKIRSEYADFNTYQMVENMFTKASRTGELGFAKETVTTTSIKNLAPGCGNMFPNFEIVLVKLSLSNCQSFPQKQLRHKATILTTS